MIGAIAIVVLAAFFRQDRVGFLVGLTFWCAASGFVATLLRNFAAYAAALAGYTAAIIAIDVLGPVGSTNGVVFIFAIDRALEIGIGIVSAGVVLALTDPGTPGESSPRNAQPCRARSWMGSRILLQAQARASTSFALFVAISSGASSRSIR